MTYARACAAGGLMTFNDSRISPQYYLPWSLLGRDPCLASHPDLKFRVCLQDSFKRTRSSGEADICCTSYSLDRLKNQSTILLAVEFAAEEPMISLTCNIST